MGTICGNELIPQYTIIEKDKNEKETGRWICRNCYWIEYNRDDYVERYKIGHRKTGNLVYLNHMIGDNYDNYKSPIDCYDPKTGLYHQVQGRCYYSVQGTWPFSGFKREWKKIFENMVCFCFSKDGKIVERIYKFLWEEIMRVTGITVFNNDNYHRYDKYKVIDKEEIKKVNDIWKEIIDKTK